MVARLRAVWRVYRNEYRYERRECSRLRAFGRVADLFFAVYINPRQECAYCWYKYWTVTPWREGVCGHPSCVAHLKAGDEPVVTISFGES